MTRSINTTEQRYDMTMEQQKYQNIKRKLKETIEMNESLNLGFLKAKKKLKTLRFERNLLLERLAQINHHHASHSSDELLEERSSGTSDSDIESNNNIILSFQSNRKQPTTIQSQSPTNTTNPRRVTSTKMTTVASAPPKRSKINRINVKTRRVQPIEKDEFGNPKLPQQIGVLTVLNLGVIKTNRETFHNERYIFPVGYTVKRTYPSMIDPNNNTIVTSTIVDGGDGPRFHVVAADQPNEPIVANSATGAWTVVVRKSNEIRQREHSNSASGPDYYGFKHPTIAKMIQDLPGTQQLRNYVWQNFEEMEPRAAKGVMAAAEKKRDNLELMGNANRRIGQESEHQIVSPVIQGNPSPFFKQQHSSQSTMMMESEEEVYELEDL